MKLLSILIPTTPKRSDVLTSLLYNLHTQIEKLNYEGDIEILFELDNGELTVGAKRQKLLERSKGKYITQIDDDDEVPEYYLEEIVKGIYTNADVISFDGFLTTNGEKRENFKIRKDLPYITIQDAHGNNEYLRYCNHLSPIKREIALQIGFKDVSFAEDYDYATRLKESGLIKNEHVIEKDMYHYKYISNK